MSTVAFVDFDNDGATDIFVSPNLVHGSGDGVFTNSPVDFGGQGGTESGWADVDGDGYPDVVMIVGAAGGGNEGVVFRNLPLLGSGGDPAWLTVGSPLGSPVPGVGSHSNDYGALVQCTVSNLLDGDSQYACTGWVGTGSVPADGATNVVTVRLTEDSSITWLWQTNHWLDVGIAGDGAVSPGDGWYRKGSSQSVVATPAAGWLFMDWGDDASGTNTSATVVMDAPRTVTATFSDDADGDGLSNTEEDSIGSHPRKADTDSDGFGDKLEVDNGGSPVISDQWRVDHIRSHGRDFDLYPSNAVLDVALGQILLETSGTTARLSLQLRQSEDLSVWTNAGDVLEWTQPVGEGTHFLRVRSSE
jgi:hypothetical protein